MPPRFRVDLAGQALRALGKLQPAEQEMALAQILRHLSDNPLPRPPLIRKIAGSRQPIFRLRLKIHREPWRAFYRLEPGAVVVFALVSKKEANRLIRRLS